MEIAKKGEWEFSRQRKDLQVWNCRRRNDVVIGPRYVTFDKKIIYNLWSDADKLTAKQKELIKEFYPIMWGLTLSGR